MSKDETEVLGTFWCRIGDKSSWWNRGLMTRDEALAAAVEVLAPEKDEKGKVNPNGGYGYVTVTTPSTDPPNVLPSIVLGGDKGGLYGPWAPTSEADPVIVAALSGGSARLKGIQNALMAAGWPGGRGSLKALRGHLRRLGYKCLPKTTQLTSERWGR